jgi:hypothetical protein
MNPFKLFWLFFTPTKAWQELMQSPPSVHQLYLLHVVPFSLIPPVMIYIAGNRHNTLLFDLLPGNKLTIIAVAIFIVQLVAVPVMAMIIRQLAEIIEIHPPYKDAFIVAAIAPTPLWMAPLFLIVPDILVNIAITSWAMMASAGLIYYGIPAVFKLKEPGQALLLFGGILMAGVIAWGFLMVCTLVVWGAVQNLQFAAGPVIH